MVCIEPIATTTQFRNSTQEEIVAPPLQDSHCLCPRGQSFGPAVPYIATYPCEQMLCLRASRHFGLWVCAVLVTDVAGKVVSGCVRGRGDCADF
eukprot:5362043-Amphidinium_carterae.1